MKSWGFTVLEALVSMVIVSMVAVLLMQSLSQILGLRERVLRSESEARIAALQEHWFRDSLAAVMADIPGGIAPFSGSSRAVRFLGLDPIDGGYFAVVEWQILDSAEGLELTYRRDDHANPVVVLRGLSRASFRYQDGEGRWSDAWPPVPAAPDPPDVVTEVLPRAVELVMPDDSGSRVWRVGIGASPALPLPIRIREEVRRGAL